MKFKEIESKIKSLKKDLIKKFFEENKKINIDNSDSLCKNLVKKISEEIKKLEFDLKFIINVYIFHKNNIWVNMNSSCIIDLESDGSISIREEIDDYIIILNTYGISID